MMTKSDKRACAVNRGPPARAATKSFRCDASSVVMLRSMLLFGTWKNNSIARLLLASVTQAEAGHRLSCRHAAFYTCFLHQEILDGMGSLDQLGRSQADGLQFPCSDQGGSGWASKYLDCCVMLCVSLPSWQESPPGSTSSNHLQPFRPEDTSSPRENQCRVAQYWCIFMAFGTCSLHRQVFEVRWQGLRLACCFLGCLRRFSNDTDT